MLQNKRAFLLWPGEVGHTVRDVSHCDAEQKATDAQSFKPWKSLFPQYNIAFIVLADAGQKRAEIFYLFFLTPRVTGLPLPTDSRGKNKINLYTCCCSGRR